MRKKMSRFLTTDPNGMPTRVPASGIKKGTLVAEKMDQDLRFSAGDHPQRTLAGAALQERRLAGMKDPKRSECR
jgi:hypothetical protein